MVMGGVVVGGPIRDLSGTSEVNKQRQTTTIDDHSAAGKRGVHLSDQWRQAGPPAPGQEEVARVDQDSLSPGPPPMRDLTRARFPMLAMPACGGVTTCASGL